MLFLIEKEEVHNLKMSPFSPNDKTLEGKGASSVYLLFLFRGEKWKENTRRVLNKKKLSPVPVNAFNPKAPTC